MKKKIQWNYDKKYCQFKLDMGLAKFKQCPLKSWKGTPLCKKHNSKKYLKLYKWQGGEMFEPIDLPPPKEKPKEGLTPEIICMSSEFDGDTFQMNVLKRIVERQEQAVDVLRVVLKQKAADLGVIGAKALKKGDSELNQNRHDVAMVQAITEFRDANNVVKTFRRHRSLATDPVWRQVVGIVDAIGRAGMVEKQVIAQMYEIQKYQRDGAVVVDSFEFNIAPPPAPEQ